MNENYGKIVQVMGPVVDVVFSGAALPQIKEALEVELDGRREVMEVAQHIGGRHGAVHYALSQRGPGARHAGLCHRCAHFGAWWARAYWAECSMCWEMPLMKRALLQHSRSGPFTGTHRPFRIRDQWWIFLKLESRSLICWHPMPRAEKLPVWRRRCGQDGADSGIDSQHRHRTRRVFDFYGRR